MHAASVGPTDGLISTTVGDEPAADSQALEPSPRRPGRVRTNVGLVVAAVVVISVGVLAFVIAGGTYSGAGLATAERADDATTVPSSSDTADDRVDVQVPAGAETLRFQLPPGWVANAPGAGVSGEERFPSDDELSRVFDEYVQVATEQGAVLFALDTDLTGQSSARVFYNRPQPDVTFATSVQAGRQVLEDTPGVDLTVDEPIELSPGTGHLFRYTTEVDGAPLHNVQVAIPAAQGSYVLVGQSYDAGTIDQLISLAPTIELS